MREFQIMVDPLGAVTVSGSSRLLGYGGEHNVARLNINFNDYEQSVFKDAGYYRLALGDYYSDALYLENGKLSYLVPFDAVTPPMIYCQIIGYTDKEGEPVKIAKSSVFTMEVKFSKVPRAVISNSTDVFERTLAKCEVALKSSLEASNEARLYAESAALSMERSVESSAVAIQSANSARVAAEKAEEAIGTLENFAMLNNNVANAIKRTAKGNVVSVSDVSPIEHDVQVKLTSDILTDFSNIKVKRHGKNLYPGITNAAYNSSNNNVAFEVTQNGGIKLEGTASGLVIININVIDLPNGTYTASTSLQGVSAWAFFTDGEYTGGSPFTITDTRKIRLLQIRIPNEITVSDVCYYQIEEGTVPTEYEPYIEPMEYSVNADGTIGGENSVIYTESDGNNFVTYTKVEDADPDYGYLTFDTSLMGNAKALRLTAKLQTASPTFVYDFSFTRGVTADSYGTATDIYTDETYPITADAVVISVENGMPEKLYTTGAESLIKYTAELIFEGDTTIKSIYPSMSLLTDTDGVLIDVEYNRDINKAFAELQEAIINLGGILNV